MEKRRFILQSISLLEVWWVVLMDKGESMRQIVNGTNHQVQCNTNVAVVVGVVGVVEEDLLLCKVYYWYNRTTVMDKCEHINETNCKWYKPHNII
jgi:hypothetical protein